MKGSFALLLPSDLLYNAPSTVSVNQRAYSFAPSLVDKHDALHFSLHSISDFFLCRCCDDRPFLSFCNKQRFNQFTGKEIPILGLIHILQNIAYQLALQSFDNAAYANALPNIPYMIGYTQDDMGDMAPGIAEFCLNRESVGDKAYAYEFARPLPTDGRDNVLSGAFHSSDLWYVFKSLQHCWRPWTQGDWDLSEVMLTAWTNFAKYGDPNGPDGGEWKPYTQENGNFMLFKLDENDAEASETGDPIPSQNRRFPF